MKNSNILKLFAECNSSILELLSELEDTKFKLKRSIDFNRRVQAENARLHRKLKTLGIKEDAAGEAVQESVGVETEESFGSLEPL